MASISRASNGRRSLQFVAGDGKRKSIRLGKISQHAAEVVKSKVEMLNGALIAGLAVDGETAKWLAGIGDELHAKLVAVALVTPRLSQAIRLKVFIDGYIASR